MGIMERTSFSHWALHRFVPARGEDDDADSDFLGGWQLGIFLCMRCATIHRKLGTHVSKVKSLSMDSWTNEQVDVSVP